MVDAKYIPLPDRMRPQSLAEIIGQQHLLSVGKPLRLSLEQGILHSLILWGPPGSGKTTLARLFSQSANAYWTSLSAVSAGVKDIRQITEIAKQQQQLRQQTVLFIDEIHRFNKSQQDALLPQVESGDVILMGATTENPSFELNRALLSRLQVYCLLPLSEAELTALLQRAVSNIPENNISLEPDVFAQLAIIADGDARRALNLLERLLDFARVQNQAVITLDLIPQALTERIPAMDNGGDVFYDLISALHKSVRGSDPDASLYWFARMLIGGCDPIYIARRLVRMASEDIGNADPRALTLALNAWDVQERLGSPEGELALAQAVTYLASCAKSNAVYTAYQSAMQMAKQYGSQSVPIHLRNAPTKLMKDLGYGRQYRYAHDEPHAYAAGESYWPEKVRPQQLYSPTDRGLEQQIQKKLAWLKQLDASVS